MTNREKMQLIADRLMDYQEHDVAAARAKLIAMWRAVHPEAAKEVSIALHPLMQIDSKGSLEGHDAPDEYWVNDVYHVTLRRREDRCFGTGGRMIQLGINAHDGTARHDWREFQAIKNQLAGPECEAFELYPAESRLMDPSNYYTLWCFPDLKRIKVGTNQERRVWNADEALAPQRAF
jgi:hypothetical protein